MVTHDSRIDVWDALAEQRRHQLPPGMTVADIQRQRDGWDDAFDPEVWERLSGEKGAVAPPGAFGGDDSWTGALIDCTDEEKDRWNLIRTCLSTAFFGQYLWLSVEDWCSLHTRPAYTFFGDAVLEKAEWLLNPCTCANSKWLLGDPSQWPDSVRSDMEQVCAYTLGLGREAVPTVEPDGRPFLRCAYWNWARLDFDRMMTSEYDPGSCAITVDGAAGGPCVKVYWFEAGADVYCDPRYKSPGGSPGPGRAGALPWEFPWEFQRASCGCWTVNDFGTDCYCGAATVDCRPENGACRCSGSCYWDGESCDWGPMTYDTVVQDCRTV